MSPNGICKKSSPDESSIQSKIIKYLRSRNAFILNPKTGTYSKKGVPDLHVCYRGMYIAIEVKVPGKTPDETQQLRLKQIRDAGGYTISVTTLEEVKEFIHDISTIQQCGKSR